MCQLIVAIQRVGPVSLPGMMVVLAVVLGTSYCRAEPGSRVTASRIASLISQLGDDEFARREEASKELVAIEPALPALQKAAASDSDPEIRWRAIQAIQGIVARQREVTGRKDLEKLQGTWYTVSFVSGGTKTPENRNDTITCEGNRYVHMLNGQLISAGHITMSDATGSPKQLELNATEGPCAGCCFRSIYRVEGSDLILCYNGGNPADTNRPATFSDIAGILRVMMRVQKSTPK